MSSTGITFYGGVHEIGGNKFLVEKTSLKDFQKIEEENRELELEQMKKDALRKRDDNEEST